jgi:RNA-directed DNA polymerase
MNANLSVNNLLSPTLCCQAFTWLCQQRKAFPPNADIWHFRFNYPHLLAKLKADITGNRYTLSPLQRITKSNGERIALMSAQDAFVLKLLSISLQSILPFHQRCIHIKGRGGSKKSLEKTHQQITSGQYAFVLRTDIKGYYANINKHQLLEQLAQFVHCPIILNLLGQFLYYSVEHGGNFHTPKRGISRGCALSPLLAGFQLYSLDQSLDNFCQKQGCRYIRYMDDFLVLTTTRWQLRTAVKLLNQGFNHFGFKQHPDKTFIGRIERGFDWLGYQLNEQGLCGAAPRALQHHATKIRQLYEQTKRRCLSKKQTTSLVTDYRQRWQQWLLAGFTDQALRESLACHYPNWHGISK